jgi:hypothetical protein
MFIKVQKKTTKQIICFFSLIQLNTWIDFFRRTPRRKLFSSSEDDDSPLLMSLKTSKSISFIDDNNNSTGKIFLFYLNLEQKSFIFFL